MRGRIWFMGLLSILFLAGCQQISVETPPSEIMSTDSPSTFALYQDVYTRFLQPDSQAERRAAREAESGYSSFEEYYSIADIDGDKIPELVIVYWEFGRYYVNLYVCEGNVPCLIGTFCAGRNGPFLYVCPEKAILLTDLVLYGPEGTSHTWQKYTMADNGLSEEKLLHELIPWAEDGPEPVPKGAPTEAAELVPGVRPLDLTPITASLEPWQEAYRDILLQPEEYGEFYAVAEHIPSDQYERREIPTKIEHYCFAVCDVNGDGTQELLLWGDHLLLNILRYHEETGTVEDMDGPRTYPLMDTLFFYDTGYFGTINGAGGLYTEYWRLEKEDPDRYWYGYQRPYDSDYDGPRTTEIISFYSSDGEEFTLREYYERMGESGVTPSWQEVTEGAVLQALLAAGGKEVP